MNFSQNDQLTWERIALISGKRFFHTKDTAFTSRQGNAGLTMSVSVKDLDDNIIRLDFEDGILINVENVV
jgi:hypothetical protein